MENSTEVRPVNLTKIRTELVLNEAERMEKAFNDTSNTQGYNPNDTSYTNNNAPINNLDFGFNREIRRYAKKHKISCKEAFKKLYK